jgi:hypothetical protein
MLLWVDRWFGFKNTSIAPGVTDIGSGLTRSRLRLPPRSRLLLNGWPREINRRSSRWGKVFRNAGLTGDLAIASISARMASGLWFCSGVVVRSGKNRDIEEAKAAWREYKQRKRATRNDFAVKTISKPKQEPQQGE